MSADMDGTRHSVFTPTRTVGQSVEESLVLEVDSDVPHGGRDADAGLAQPVALPGARRRVVDLPHREVRPRVAVGEGVEAGAEDDVLPRAVRHCRSEAVLGEATARVARLVQNGSRHPLPVGDVLVNFGFQIT